MAKTSSPFDACLAPLARLATAFPEMEGQVIWWQDSCWQAQEEEDELLFAEELTFYAEGMLAEGIALRWQALAEAEAPKMPVLVRLFFAEGPLPALPAPEPGWVVQSEGAYPPA
jgi:hypothetical protein